MSNLSNPWVVLRPCGSWTTAYVHDSTGQGRAKRRSLVVTVHVPIPLASDTLSNVLRAVAQQIDLPPIARWQPRP